MQVFFFLRKSRIYSERFLMGRTLNGVPLALDGAKRQFVIRLSLTAGGGSKTSQ